MATAVTEATFQSRYGNHTLNFDGIPVIRFKSGIFKTSNPRQSNALRNCKDFERGVIKEVAPKEGK